MSITVARPQRAARPGRARRVLAGAVSTAVAAAGLAVVAAPAQAAEPTSTPAPSLTWKVSDTYVTAFSTRTLTGGVTFDASTGFTFPNGVGSYNPTSGVTTIKYDGTVKGAFFAEGKDQYHVTIAEPTVTVDDSGNGQITAVVSSANIESQQGPAASTPPTRVKVTTFSAAGNWSTAANVPTLSATPDWAGVLAPDSDAADALGITNPAHPVEGKSFAPEFLGAIVPGVRPRFYVTTSGDVKRPSPFVAQAPVATITSASVKAQNATSLAVAVTGSGYAPGGNGIYIAVAETGLAPTASSSSYLGAVSSTSASNPDAAVKADGTFSALLKLSKSEIALLDPAKSYSVYTIKARGGNITDPSQSDSVPLAIDFAGFAKKSSAPVLTAPSSVFGAASSVKVSVPTVGSDIATGSVTLAGAGTQTVALVNGSATFSLPAALAGGTTSLTASYTGDENYRATSSTAVKTVTPAKVAVKRGSTTKPTTKKNGKTTVTLTSSTGASVTGQVKVTFKQKGQKTKTKTAYVSTGSRVVTIPKLAKGRWTVSVKYLGNASFARTLTMPAGTFKVTK